MKFTVDGFSIQDVEDFAKSRGYTDTIPGENGDIPNPVSAGQYCKDYLKMMFTNEIGAYREKQAKAELEKPNLPVLTVS